MKRAGLILPVVLLPLVLGAVLVSTPLRASVARSTPGTPAAQAVAPAQNPDKEYLPVIGQAFFVNPFGIALYGPVDQTNGLAQMQAAGAKRVSTMLDWNVIEPTPGVLDWTSSDTKIRNARNAGMDTFVLFAGDPQWAWAGTPTNRTTDPVKRLNFVRALVERYDCDGSQDAPGGNLCVRDWSFYPEPDYDRADLRNIPGAKGYWGRRAKEYAQMIKDVSVAVHQQDPNARVMIGALAYDRFDTDGGPFIRSFLPDVLNELNTVYGGASNYLNAIAVHYYPIKFPTMRAKLTEIRGLMQTYNVARLPLLVPEAGYWSQADSNEQQQAQRLVQFYAEALAMDVEQVSWFTVFDDGPGQAAWGLFRGRDLNQPKPAYVAYQNAARNLVGVRFVADLKQDGVEGYVFQKPDAGLITVAWATEANAQLTLDTTCAAVESALGTATRLADGSMGDQDKRRNGQTTLALKQQEAIFVQSCR